MDPQTDVRVHHPSEKVDKYNSTDGYAQLAEQREIPAIFSLFSRRLNMKTVGPTCVFRRMMDPSVQLVVVGSLPPARR